MRDFANCDATGLATLTRDGEVSAEELVQAAIDAIEAVNPRVNAVVAPMFDEARRAAAGPLVGPFAGVPFLLKDLVAEYAGVPLSEGSAFLGSRYVPARDSELVARYRRAGFVILGKTNTPEFGLQPTTEPALFGPTRNPWNVERTPGGSSGGSAAAVAAGLVPAAHANDGGGSIRIPAACCGLFGLKPTRARNPLGPAYGDAGSGLACEHVVTRSVRDSAAILDATTGPDPGDPYCAPPPARPFLEEVGADPGRLRIAFSAEPPTDLPVHPECVAAVETAAKLCEQLGHHVEEAAPPLDGRIMGRAFGNMWLAFAAWAIDDWARRIGREPVEADFELATWAMYQRGRGVSGGAYLMAVQDLQAVGRTMAHFHETWDIWLTPVLAEPPVPLGTFDAEPDDPLAGVRRGVGFAPFTPVCNGSGQPAMSVPLHWTADGLPVGSHFSARFGDEATLFRLAAQLEQAQPWAGRRPPVHVAA